MRTRVAMMLLAAATMALTGCGREVVGPPPPPTTTVNTAGALIGAFVRSQPLPEPQPARVFVTLPRSDVQFFSLEFGDLHYDLAGNWYSAAWGIRYGRSVGWVKFSETLSIPGLTMFDPSGDQSWLYAASTWAALQADSLSSRDQWFFQGAFIPLLAGDSDTPEETLLVIANEYLSAWVAWQLLGNPTAAKSRAVLTVIADHPVQGPWDSWAPIHDRALALLDALP